MRRGWGIWVGVLVLVLIGAFYVWLYVLRDSTTQTDVGEAVVEFRQQDDGANRIAPALRSRVPDLGVYRYRTRGHETLDIGFGTTNDFDGVSTITLTASRCGIRERWQVLVERWNDSELCLSPEGGRLRRLVEFHQFFGSGRLTEYTCRENPVPFTNDLRPGMTWTSRCESESGIITTEVEVEAIEVVEVDGNGIPAVRIAARAELEGDPDGSAERVSWLRRSDGLLLRREASSQARVQVLGGSDFSEEVVLELISASPRR